MNRTFGKSKNRCSLLIVSLGVLLFLWAPSSWALDYYLNEFTEFLYVYDAERFHGGERDYRSLFVQRYYREVTGPLGNEKWGNIWLMGDFEQSLDGTKTKSNNHWSQDYENTTRGDVGVRLELLPAMPVNPYFGFRQSWAQSKTPRETDGENRTEWEGGVRLKLPYNINILVEHQEVLGKLRLLGIDGFDPDAARYIRNSFSRVELTHHSSLDDIFLAYIFHQTRDFSRDYDSDIRSSSPVTQHLGILRARVNLSSTVILSTRGEYSQEYMANKVINLDTDHISEQDGETRLVDTVLQLDWTPRRTTQVSLAYGFSYTRKQEGTIVDTREEDSVPTIRKDAVENFRRNRIGLQLTQVITDKLGLLSDIAYNHSQINAAIGIPFADPTLFGDEDIKNPTTDIVRYRLRLVSLHIPYIRIVPQYTLLYSQTADFSRQLNESTTHNISLGVETVSWRGMQAYSLVEFEHRHINFKQLVDTSLMRSWAVEKLLAGQVGIRGTPFPRLNVDTNFRYTDSTEIQPEEGASRTASVRCMLDYEVIEDKLHLGAGWEYLWRSQRGGTLWGETGQIKLPLDRRDGIVSFVADYRPVKTLSLSLNYNYRFYRSNHATLSAFPAPVFWPPTMRTTAWLNDIWEVSPRISWNFYRDMILTLQYSFISVKRIKAEDSIRYYGMIKLTIPLTWPLNKKALDMAGL